MSRKLTNLEFISKCIIKHDNKYDYSKTIYKTSKEKVTIVCKIHGEFEQKANDHTKKIHS